jgi:hypothetical protein
MNEAMISVLASHNHDVTIFQDMSSLLFKTFLISRPGFIIVYQMEYKILYAWDAGMLVLKKVTILNH